MERVALSRAFFQGAASVEEVAGGGLRPWRVPHDQRQFFPSPDDSLLSRAECTSGVRLRFSSTTTSVALEHAGLAPQDPGTFIAAGGELSPHSFDVTVDGEIVVTTVADASGRTLISGLPAGQKVLELWLPQATGITLLGLAVDAGTSASVVPDSRKVWLTYGSSLTHCTRAFSPAQTWPALVARKHGLHLINLGYGGQCHIEPMFGFLIASFKADYITLKVGINNLATLGPRTYPGCCIGLVRIIREACPTTPITLISPISFPPGETTPSPTGQTIQQQRTDLEQVAAAFVDAGDAHLRYVNGLEVLNHEENAATTSDQCHPDGGGMHLMADNFSRAVMAGWLPPSPSL